MTDTYFSIAPDSPAFKARLPTASSKTEEDDNLKCHKDEKERSFSTKNNKPQMPPKAAPVEKHNIDYAIEPNERLSQGDIYESIIITESIADNADDITVSKIEYPFAILMNQDCDLNSDNRSRNLCKEELEKAALEGRPSKLNHDKHLIWLLFVPMYPFEQFKTGSHLSDIDLKMSQVNDGTLISKEEDFQRK